MEFPRNFSQWTEAVQQQYLQYQISIAKARTAEAQARNAEAQARNAEEQARIAEASKDEKKQKELASSYLPGKNIVFDIIKRINITHMYACY